MGPRESLLISTLKEGPVYHTIEARMVPFGLEHEFLADRVTLIERVVVALESASVTFRPTGSVLKMGGISNGDVDVLKRRVDGQVKDLLENEKVARHAVWSAQWDAFNNNVEQVNAAIKKAKKSEVKMLVEIASELENAFFELKGFVDKGLSKMLKNELDDKWNAFNSDRATILVLVLALWHAFEETDQHTYKEQISTLKYVFHNMIQVPEERKKKKKDQDELGAAHLRNLGGAQISTRTANRYNI